MRALLRRLTSPSFRSKVFLASFICIGIPVILSLSIYSYLTRDAVEEQAMQNATKALDLTEENVSHILDDMLNVSNFVQIDSELNTILKNKSNMSLSALENQDYTGFLEDRQIQKTIEDITLLGEKSFVTILLENGKYYTNYTTAQFDPYSLYDEEWLNKLEKVNGYETYWSGVEPTMLQYEKIQNPYQLSVGKTLRSNNKEIYGYVIVTLLETKVRTVLMNKNESEELMLMDGNNTILSHQDPQQINNKAAFVAQLNPRQSSQIVELQGQKYVITQKELTFNDWKLVSKVPYKQATSNINSIFSKVFILLAVSFAVFFVILAYLMRRITKPLRYLERVVRKVQGGDLSVRSQVESKDEIGEFSQSLNNMLDRVNMMITEVSHTHKRKRKAELAMLQAQINPHFLFNVLNSIRMKVFRFGDKESAGMIQSLSKLLRWTIDNQDDQICFRDELGLIRDYVKLMNMRQKNKVTLLIECTDQTNDQMVPRFLLQPLIENAIIHGLNQGEGEIRIEADVNDYQFTILISDNGAGMSESALARVNNTFGNATNKTRAASHSGFSSIGMTNVYERLQLSYRKKPEMLVKSKEYVGTTIEIIIPLGGEEDVQGNVS
ncbi:sensor histidine kinase [Gracilibacillus salinarum]|uniref:Sensor histidine kinase n=1 Tax=Gracilibacillus salinarum TaxID=2932255 RepID=A0ABY4GM76_9BACI|nr:sensor histidine kinase [Gracilibacillus salinarum]UOQ85055.1 sensor histidine kinase [Gracilibacillus salinarum]